MLLDEYFCGSFSRAFSLRKNVTCIARSLATALDSYGHVEECQKRPHFVFAMTVVKIEREIH